MVTEAVADAWLAIVADVDVLPATGIVTIGRRAAKPLRERDVLAPSSARRGAPGHRDCPLVQGSVPATPKRSRSRPKTYGIGPAPFVIGTAT